MGDNMHLIANGGIVSLNIGNTVDAIMLTKYVGYVEGVKLDVYKTIDNYFVLANNDDLSKDTLSKRFISKSTYDDIKNTKYQSHIFKYFIPKLEDILKYYVSDKKIFLELHFKDNIDELYKIISKYPYEYIIINDKNDYIYCDNPIDINIDTINNKYIITRYPEKFYNLFKNN